MTSELTMPAGVEQLPRDKHGRPVPWFVHFEAGVPDFRVVRRDGIHDAYKFGWCWICGKPRGRHAAFTIGPMCAVNRVSAEPPSHLDCAIYAARACPFLANPSMVRRERGLVEMGRVEPPGVMITRNPGVALVWSSKTWAPFKAPDGGALFGIGDPTAVRWYAHGRDATRDEVLASIDAGLPALREAADAENVGAMLDDELARAMTLLPQ